MLRKLSIALAQINATNARKDLQTYPSNHLFIESIKRSHRKVCNCIIK